ncbi:MAG: TetR/AcrR family transcriptional regulator [Clostridiales Family XIII bacterium]|nr:TetR/AcrR family transcriptional regulator [Clostridiales Family XIII bacterium]
MENTKQQILENSIELFKLWGYENTSINMICDACGITKKSFYYHYASKDDLILEYYDAKSSNVLNIMPEIMRLDSYRERIWRLSEFYIDASEWLGADLLRALFVTDSKNGLKTFAPDISGTGGDLSMVFKMNIEYAKLAQESGELNRNADGETMVWLFNTALIGVIIDWASKNGSYDIYESARRAFDAVFLAG